MPTDDPFGTAELRSAVLETWRRSPARLREDANAEESLALVGYAGRVVVELAANAADAAIDAGVPGRLRFAVVGDELRVANTGAPLTAAGVAALASLRASAKRSEPGGVGHFGVGFTAVLAVSDRPAVVSRLGAVDFSGHRTAVAIAELASPELSAEVAVREGHVPVLRLPWPLAGEEPPPEFDTEVRLPLRPGVAPADVLSGIGDYLLLALPGLDVIEAPGRTLSRDSSTASAVVISDDGVPTTWRLAHRTGEFSAEQLAGLPTEQRGRRRWWLSWAYPTSRPLAPDVLYSPTPTDEALDLPARLIGTFPVDDTRRHLAAGPLVDLLLDEAVLGYLDLMADTAPEDRLRLLPPRDFGRSEWDNRLRQGIWAGIKRTPLLVSAAGEAVRPDQAAMLPGATDELIALAADAIPGLLPVPRDSVERDGLRALGVRVLSDAELSSALGVLNRAPEFWGRVYGQLDTGSSADDLADLPVPLASGRMSFGARGCLLVDDPDAGWLGAIAAEIPGLRVVDPAAVTSPAARRLLLRIGAQTADPTAVLADHAVGEVLADLRDELESDDVSDERVHRLGTAILHLVEAGAVPSDHVRADLLLTSESGEPWPATELLLPGAPIASVLSAGADLEPLAARWADRYSAEVLARAGVLVGFRIVTDVEPHGADHDLPDEDQYWEQVIGDGPPPAEFTAVADLDLIADDRWSEALELLRTDRATRDVLRPVNGKPSYTAWWLSRYAIIAGRAPRRWRRPDANDLAGLYDPVPLPLDADFSAAIGVRDSLAQVLADDPRDVLARLTDAARSVPAASVPGLTAAVVGALQHAGLDQLPPGVRTMAGSVIDAERAVVLDEPWLAQVVEPYEVVPGGADPLKVAAFFDVEPASERFRFQITGPTTAVAASVRGRVLGVARELGFLGVEGLNGRLDSVVTGPALAAVDEDGNRRPVRWWAQGDAAWVDGSAEGWGRLLAYWADDWSLRHTAAALFAGRGADVVEDGLTTRSSRIENRC